ncbi:oligosaccharide flippase family protein [Halorientalis brevis]|uniref:Oligosaccharide flippase family protein n=1 Tax=Halorientalis brevis TaxID=1126241 RepID=A0ABD6CE79_9EURY|nr:oligosaccharide flippase family protein [Halorientalis brevis]
MTDVDQAIRDVVKGASVVTLGLFLELLIAFVAQVVAANYLSVADFGGLTAGTALLDLGAIVGGLGLASGLTRYLPRVDEAEKRMLVLASVGMALVTSTLLGAAVALNASFIASTVFGNPNVTVSIRVFGAAIPFATLLNVAVGGIRGQERSTYWVFVKNIVHPIVRITLVVGAVLYGLGQAGLAGAYAVPYAVSALIGLVLLHRTLPRSRAPLNRDRVEAVTRYSLPFTVSEISGFIYRSIDIFLILYYIGDAATGIYGVAYAAVSFMGVFSTAFNFLATPIASRLENDAAVDDAMEMFRAVVRWLIVASVCALVPLGVFATDFIVNIYGSKYADGGIVLTVLAVGFAAKNVLSINNSILEAVGRSKILSFNSALAAVTNLALNVVLIPRFGIIGAALATTASFLLRDGLAAVQVYLALGETPLVWQATRPIALAVPILVVVWQVVSPATPSTLLWLIAVTGLTALVYAVTVLLTFGLSETETMILRSAEEQYGLDLTRFDGLIRWLSQR